MALAVAVVMVLMVALVEVLLDLLLLLVVHHHPQLLNDYWLDGTWPPGAKIYKTIEP